MCGGGEKRQNKCFREREREKACERELEIEREREGKIGNTV